MKQHDAAADEQAIRTLIGNHFEGMKWTPDTKPDWARFSDDFLTDAVLVPAARPAKAKTLQAFLNRMDVVAKGVLQSFEEHTLGMQCLIFGNVAIVLAASEMIENNKEVNRDVSGYLLVKTEGTWRIAAHAWDKATEERPVPDHLG